MKTGLSHEKTDGGGTPHSYHVPIMGKQEVECFRLRIQQNKPNLPGTDVHFLCDLNPPKRGKKKKTKNSLVGEGSIKQQKKDLQEIPLKGGALDTNIPSPTPKIKLPYQGRETTYFAFLVDK